MSKAREYYIRKTYEDDGKYITRTPLRELMTDILSWESYTETARIVAQAAVTYAENHPPYKGFIVDDTTMEKYKHISDKELADRIALDALVQYRRKEDREIKQARMKERDRMAWK